VGWGRSNRSNIFSKRLQLYHSHSGRGKHEVTSYLCSNILWTDTMMRYSLSEPAAVYIVSPALCKGLYSAASGTSSVTRVEDVDSSRHSRRTGTHQPTQQESSASSGQYIALYTNWLSSAIALAHSCMNGHIRQMVFGNGGQAIYPAMGIN
jgi:hypothetical protein